MRSLLAQEVSNEYLPLDMSSMESYLKRINKGQMAKIDGKFSSKVRKVLKDRDEKVLKSIEDSTYVFNEDISESLDHILQSIFAANSNIDHNDFNFFVKNSIVPNAASYGDGMFHINLGLLTLMDSDDELAFIMCHEIAHKILDHSVKNISKKVTALNSAETKKKVRKLKRKRYGQTREALSLIDEVVIDILDHSKEAEVEADSLGFVLFSRTGFRRSKALSALDKLKNVDDMIFRHEVKIDSVFNFRDVPFQSFWLKESVSIFDTKKEINEFKLSSDSIKTHPEIPFRIAKLKGDHDLGQGESPAIDDDYLSKIRGLANKKSIDYTIDLNFLDLAIYQLIEKRHNDVIDDSYYYSKMADVLMRIYMAKKKHKLGKYVPQKNTFSSERQLNRIRLFLHNLELKEVKGIGLAFCSSNEEYVQSNELFENAFNFFKE